MALRSMVILIHRHGTLDKEPYYLGEIARLLHRWGVRIYLARGPQPHVAADLAFCHVDLTVLPDQYAEFLAGYKRVVNASVRDISKRRISRQLVRPGDGYEGPVIVKANLNCGGRPEAILAREGLLPRHYLNGFLGEYTVHPSPGQVESSVWHDQLRVVERFLPEQVAENLYCLRLWKFLGDAETNTLTYATDPMCKGRNCVRREEGGTVPEELRQIRRELHVDYGKFDYAMHDGKPVLFDVNLTPTFSRPMEEEMPRITAFARELRVLPEKYAQPIA